MTSETIADRYRRRAAAFTQTVAAVPEGAWAAPSPCPEWDARGVVAHVVQTQAMFAGLVGRELEPGPSVELDPLGAWVAAREQTQAALDDPLLAEVEFDGVTGRTTFAAATDRFLSFDLVVHRWDLARAAGLPDAISAEDVEALEVAIAEMSEQIGSAMRGPGAFGPELEPPDDADAQTRVLAFVGRRAW
ncbi:TIGR03086 family protein [Aquihabitans sp. G128]|uniref:TIGR03086 family metal-binding protein n=1 Tax=Aquihabitans sp. G128 TaxID=2849779 RepID=UPI001C231ECE|nr:TIGR03086 family metal-binding protein [Aquihabitans sp. G128]QXC60118.1 TIGR03086 family protein [Aquihabitans sp. G128]